MNEARLPDVLQRTLPPKQSYNPFVLTANRDYYETFGERKPRGSETNSETSSATWRSQAEHGWPAWSAASQVLRGSTGMPKWMIFPPACSMPDGTTSWRSTIAEAPARPE